MPVFESDAEAHERLGALLRAIAADEELGPQAREADAVVRLLLRNPDASVTADLRAGRGVRVETGSSSELSPDVTLAMDGDVAHRLWSGDINPLLALAHGEVRTKGPTAKVLRLLPLMVAAAPRYREWIEGGFPEVAEEPAEAAPAEAAEPAPAEAAEAAPAEAAEPAPAEAGEAVLGDDAQAEAPSPGADAAPAPREAATEEEAPASEEPGAAAEAAPAPDGRASDAPATEPDTPATEPDAPATEPEAPASDS